MRYPRFIHVRLTDDQYEFLERLAMVLGTNSISDAVRWLISFARILLGNKVTPQVARAIIEATEETLRSVLGATRVTQTDKSVEGKRRGEV